MGYIVYNVTSGYLPITASLLGSGLPNKQISSYGTYYFNDVPVGNYVLLLNDNKGCTAFENISISPAPETDYGYLYNLWATEATGVTGIASSDDWRIPTLTELQTLADYLGAGGDYTTNTVGGHLKSTDIGTAWNSPNTGADNSTGFNAVGAGYRDRLTGEFTNLKVTFTIFTSTPYLVIFRRNGSLEFNSSTFTCRNTGSSYPETGYPIRFIRNSTPLSNGETGTYEGNNGIVYPTICIGTQEWLAANLEETEYRNHSSIPYIGNDVSDNATWAALSSGAYCIYPTT